MFSIFLFIGFMFSLLYADEECKRKYSVRQNSIILTKASQSKGASFIHKQVVSMFSECYSLCCSNPECTVAVYENKVNHICFMFNCKEPNICLFTDHNDYISMLRTPDQDTKTLNSPRKPLVGNKVLTRPSMDAALGETCGTLRKCGPANSMCTSGTCICQIGYIGRGGLCVRSLCPKPELMYQCMDVSKSPFCIALYDQCNGISECGDGSDEVNCEPNQYRRPVFNDTSNVHQSNMKPNTKSTESQHRIQNVRQSSNNQQSHSKKQTNAQNRNYSHQNLAPRKNVYNQNKNFRKSNPMAENQLLLLKPKNKIPKYTPHRSDDRAKTRQQYQKASTPPERNPLYEKHQYSKLKSPPSYPTVSKVDEYYQKGSPDQSDSNNRWSGSDSSSSDYEYPSMNSNNRDSASDWEQDQYPDPPEPESPSGKYPQDRSNYVYYPDYEEESYSRPRGRYISDSDRYRPKYSTNNRYEPSMDYSTDHRDPRKGRHRMFVNFPQKTDDKTSLSTAMSAHKKIDKITAVEEVSDSKNMTEWNTAVIGLSLGLLVTAGLLVAVGFKMRSWRRRLKSSKKGGKCLTTDEGDYLINGMYL